MLSRTALARPLGAASVKQLVRGELGASKMVPNTPSISMPQGPILHPPLPPVSVDLIMLINFFILQHQVLPLLSPNSQQSVSY